MKSGVAKKYSKMLLVPCVSSEVNIVDASKKYDD